MVFAKTDPGAGGRGITAFMVDKEQPGAVIDELSDKMGIRGTQTSNLRLDLVVPDSARVGELNRALRLALQTLNVGRIMVAAQSLGVALAAYREAAKRAVDGAPSANRSSTTRASASSSPTWRPRSRRPA